MVGKSREDQQKTNVFSNSLLGKKIRYHLILFSCFLYFCLYNLVRLYVLTQVLTSILHNEKFLTDYTTVQLPKVKLRSKRSLILQEQNCRYKRRLTSVVHLEEEMVIRVKQQLSLYVNNSSDGRNNFCAKSNTLNFVCGRRRAEEREEGGRRPHWDSRA